MYQECGTRLIGVGLVLWKRGVWFPVLRNHIAFVVILPAQNNNTISAHCTIFVVHFLSFFNCPLPIVIYSLFTAHCLSTSVLCQFNSIAYCPCSLFIVHCFLVTCYAALRSALSVQWSVGCTTAHWANSSSTSKLAIIDCYLRELSILCILNGIGLSDPALMRYAVKLSILFVNSRG